MAFKLRSPAFAPGGEIPIKHAGEGSDVSPPLRWTDPPEGTRRGCFAGILTFVAVIKDLHDATA